MEQLTSPLLDYSVIKKALTDSTDSKSVETSPENCHEFEVFIYQVFTKNCLKIILFIKLYF